MSLQKIVKYWKGTGKRGGVYSGQPVWLVRLEDGTYFWSSNREKIETGKFNGKGLTLDSLMKVATNAGFWADFDLLKRVEREMYGHEVTESKETGRCTCELQTIMVNGCQCGGE